MAGDGESGSTAEARGPRRKALVTGASSGIGAAFAERLARDRYHVTLVARNAERLESLAKRLVEQFGVEAEALPADLTDASDLLRVESWLAREVPDLLVNNAGFGTFGRFVELDADGEEREIRLNVLAPVRLARACLPGMVQRGYGGIINVSSLAGEGATPYNATYGATKAYLTSFSEALFEELRGSGVRVQALLPGFTRTEFQERAGVDTSEVPGFAWLSAEQVVEASLKALDKDEALCIPGSGYRVLAGAQRLLPRGLVRRLTGATARRSFR